MVLHCAVFIIHLFNMSIDLKITVCFQLKLVNLDFAVTQVVKSELKLTEFCLL